MYDIGIMRLAIRSCAVVTLLAVILAGQSQPLDEGYSRKIKEFTTDPAFLTDLVDHLPSSPKVPTPEKALGYVAGAPDVLTYAKDVHRYMREVAKATPRVRVESMGQSEEGREMVLVLVSDESNLAKLDKYKEITGKLADPRRLSEADAEKLAAEGLVFYWATGAIHSPETGSPEMLMELVYRLAVSEHEKIRNIRKNLVVMITPVVEVDGRERQVDLYRWKKANPGNPRRLCCTGASMRARQQPRRNGPILGAKSQRDKDLPAISPAGSVLLNLVKYQCSNGQQHNLNTKH